MECDAVESRLSSVHLGSLKSKHTLRDKGRRGGPPEADRPKQEVVPPHADDVEEIKAEQMEPTSQVSFSGEHHPSGRKALRNFLKDEARFKEMIDFYVKLGRDAENTLQSENLDASTLKES